MALLIRWVHVLSAITWVGGMLFSRGDHEPPRIQGVTNGRTRVRQRHRDRGGVRDCCQRTRQLPVQSPDHGGHAVGLAGENDRVGLGAPGVFVAGCMPENCSAREGSQWLAERVSGRRLPSLKGLPEGRLVVRWYAAVEVDRFLRDVARFARERAA